jgi:hypothetical protein
MTVSTNKQIKELTAARGEVGTATALAKIGKQKFMECWKSTILATQVMALLTPEAQNLIKIHKKSFQCIDPISDKIITDGHSLLNEVLKLMRSPKSKLSNLPTMGGFDIVKWHSAMETKCISIKQKVPSAYRKSQYIIDYLHAILTVDAKSFKAEVNII